MKIVVVGAGALGGLLGSFFIRGGHHVAFVEKDGAIVDAVRERGLAYEGGSGEIRHPAAIDVSPPKNLLADGIFLCVRHGDVMGALDEVAGAVNDKTSILSFQDGVGAVPLVTARYGPSRAFAATTDLGATHHEPGHILHTGWGETIIAPVAKTRFDAAADLAAAFSQAGLKARAVPDVAGLVWTRTAVLCGLNAVATLLQSRNIRVLHDQDALGLACEAVTEAASVIRSAGITLLTDHPERLVGDFLERTADQSSAMLQAMQTGRASEIDAQNGAVVALAEEYGLDAPVNRTLLRLGRALEATLRAE